MEPVIIKRIGSQKITLTKLKILDKTVKVVAIFSGGFVFALGILRMALFMDWVSYMILAGLCIPIMIIAGEFGEVPYYKISIVGHYNNNIYIPKTNDPDGDQLAICRAAKDLEIKAVEYDNECKAIKSLAENCK